jgi:hypothetical protein
MRRAEETAGYIFDVLVGRPDSDLPKKAAELADKCSGPAGYMVTVAQVNEALAWIRQNSVALGWTVPNVRAGGSADRTYRVVPTMVGASVSDDEAAAVEDGWKSRVEYAHTTVDRALEPLRFAAAHADHPSTKVTLRAAVGFGEMLVKSLEIVMSTW